MQYWKCARCGEEIEDEEDVNESELRMYWDGIDIPDTIGSSDSLEQRNEKKRVMMEEFFCDSCAWEIAAVKQRLFDIVRDVTDEMTVEDADVEKSLV